MEKSLFIPHLRTDAMSAHGIRMMMARDVPVLSDRKDEQDASVWRGDHLFSSEAASYSLVNFIEPEVAREHPDWSTGRIKSEASQRFTKRLAQDLTYEHNERNHVETTVVWKPHVTSAGDVELATEYGDGYITLRELWEHTREFAEYSGNPEAYNAAEARAQLTMQEKFLRGDASQYVSMLSHPDSIRYVQIWEKATDGTVSSRQLDLHKTTGRDFTHNEGDALVAALSAIQNDAGHEVSSVSLHYSHVFLKHGTIKEDQIRTLASAISMNILPEPYMNQDDTRSRVRDSSFDMTLVGAYIGDKIRLRLAENSLAEHAVRDHNVRNRNDIDQKDTPEFVKKTGHQIKEGVSAAQAEGNMAHADASPREQSSLLSVFTDWYITRVLADMIREKPDIAHAGVYWLSILCEKPKNNHGNDMPTQKTPLNQRPKFNRERTVISAKSTTIGMIDRQIALGVHAKKSKNQPEERVRVLTHRLAEFAGSIKERVVRTLFRIDHQLQKAVEKPEFKPMVRTVLESMPHTVQAFVVRVKEFAFRIRDFLSERITRAMRKDISVKSRNVAGNGTEEKQQVKRTVSVGGTGEMFNKEAVRDMYGHIERQLAVWFVVFFDASVLRRSVRSGTEVRILREQSAEVQTPWLLLAIIRYLVLLHESGSAVAAVKRIQKRPKRQRASKRRLTALVRTRQTARLSIIFTLAS